MSVWGTLLNDCALFISLLVCLSFSLWCTCHQYQQFCCRCMLFVSHCNRRCNSEMRKFRDRVRTGCYLVSAKWFIGTFALTVACFCINCWLLLYNRNHTMTALITPVCDVAMALRVSHEKTQAALTQVIIIVIVITRAFIEHWLLSLTCVVYTVVHPVLLVIEISLKAYAL